jgi:hypothetical protein
MDAFDAHAVLPRLGALRATSRDGTNTRSIALLGLLLADPAIWREGALGGCAATITPIEKSARQWFTKLSHAGHGAGGGSGSAGDAPFDLVVPLTHQLVANDEALARCDIGFPLILGAHDHQECVSSLFTCNFVFNVGAPTAGGRDSPTLHCTGAANHLPGLPLLSTGTSAA